jgi:hypothetical protein
MKQIINFEMFSTNRQNKYLIDKNHKNIGVCEKFPTK